MAKSSGGTRNNSSGNFLGYVSVINRNDETRWLEKRFRTQSQAEAWVNKVSERFSMNSKTGTATYGAVDKTYKNRSADVVYSRDFAEEHYLAERRRIRRATKK